MKPGITAYYKTAMQFRARIDLMCLKSIIKILHYKHICRVLDLLGGWLHKLHK